MTHEAFLQAILDNPDDDGPRLVYADWLEERGDPRGEFIRIQIELAKMAEDDSRQAAFRAREAELLHNHERVWIGPLFPYLASWSFHRGFLDGIGYTVEAYLGPASLVARSATIRRIKVELDGVTISPSVIEAIPASVAWENLVLPIGVRGRNLVLAMQNPNDQDTLQKLCFILNRDIEAAGADPGQITDALRRHYGQLEVLDTTDSFVCEFIDPGIVFPISCINLDFRPEDDNTPVAKLVKLIIEEAHGQKATEVRIEWHADSLRIRYRIDGKLVERDTPPSRLRDMILARIRHLAGMDIGHQGQVQRGRIQGTINGRSINHAVNIRETANGFRVVIRINVP